MAFFKSDENRIKCGRCNTEFDLNKNQRCPLCRFGFHDEQNTFSDKRTEKIKVDYLSKPPKLNLKSVSPKLDNNEARYVGTWGMFNSFFSGKALARFIAHKMKETKKDYLVLSEVINEISKIFDKNKFSTFRGFPSKPYDSSSQGRFVHHFIFTFYKMGLFDMKAKEKNKESLNDESWSNILITLTKEGLEFAELDNKIFDEKQETQVLTNEEKKWLLSYLKKIDKKKFKEYSMLKDVYQFIKQGNSGKDLLNWFKKNDNFIEYIRNWSRKVDNQKKFKDQIENLSITFASSKIALLRELGIIRNKRNDYTIVGEL